MPKAIIRLLRAPVGRRRRGGFAVRLAPLAAAALLAPAVAGAASVPTGGTGYDDEAAPVLSADGSSLAAPSGALLGAKVTFSGRLTGTLPGHAVAVQRLDPRKGWVPVSSATVGTGGSFSATWKADWAGTAMVRALPAGAEVVTAAIPPTRAVAIFRPATATWYGPGFYGRRTACGQRMSRTLVGVAHRSLPCGTRVTVFAKGRMVSAPVVDRGPFRRGASYDLTVAAARVLGMTTTTRVGVLRTGSAPAVAAPVPAAAPAAPAPEPGATPPGGVLYAAG